MALLDDKGLGYLVRKLKDMFAPKSHTHDDRYYTESEIDGKLSGKANSSHTHTKAQVGLGNVDNTADSVKSVNYANNAGTANEINPNNSYGSITKAVRPMFDSVRANRLAFLPSDQIIIEKTVDGGKTWTDAAITDYNKRALFSENYSGFTLPQIDGKKNALCGIRLTITGMKYDVPAGTTETAKYNYWNSKYVKDTERYCTIGDMFFWVSGGGDDISLVIERATGAASTSWTNLFTSSNSTGYLEGWSGPNYIKFSESTLGGGTGQTSNYWNYRFTFMSHPWNGSAFNSNYITQAQNVSIIKAYGASVWTTPNNLMSNDHIYKWDVDENVVFPAKVTASGFNGTATKLARDGDLANPMTFNWKGKDGQPTWLWGGEDGGNMYVYNPSKFNVNSAKTAASADSANKLTTNAGSATQPVYFSNGVPVATTYTLGKSVPANAVFTDTTYDVATASSNGLMSKGDKAKLNALGDIVMIQKSLNLTTDWMDTGIAGENLSDGTYIIQVSGLTTNSTGFYQEVYSGVMTWFSSMTNSSGVDEIPLHNAGHAENGNEIYLRTARMDAGSDRKGRLKLQIAALKAGTAADTITFKFRKMI